MAILASLLIGPRACEATCGDYLHDGDHSATPFRLLNQPANSDMNSGNNSADTQVPHRPCHGPGCSGRSVPLPAPFTNIVVSVEHWALAPANPLPNFVSSHRFYGSSVDHDVDGFRTGILRPPM